MYIWIGLFLCCVSSSGVDQSVLVTGYDCSVFQYSTRAYEHSGFILRLILDGTDIKYEPEFKDFEIVLINVYDVMIKSVGVVPRVETKLYSEWVSLIVTNYDQLCRFSDGVEGWEDTCTLQE